MKNRSTKTIGITGGIASGKSAVARMLENLGATVINADDICHKLLKTQAIKDKICRISKDIVKDESGRINMASLAKIVFSNKEDAERLNKIIHPIVIRRIKRDIARIKRNGTTDVIVIDAALLEESGLSSICDIVIFVNTRMDIRKRRSKRDRQWERDEIQKREAFQMPARIKKGRARFIINNDDSKDNTFKQVRDLWNKSLKHNPETATTTPRLVANCSRASLSNVKTVA